MLFAVEEVEMHPMIRQDIANFKPPATPKNELEMVKLTSQLIENIKPFYFSTQIDEDLESEEDILAMQKKAFTEFKEQLTHNAFRVKNNLDEFSLCKYIASKQIIYFKQAAFFLDMFIQIIKQLKKVYRQKLATEDFEGDNFNQKWY